jgi:acyl carrier protein
MTREDRILAIVRRFVQDQGEDPSKVVLEAHLPDLGIDSLHALDLLFRFEEEFAINIPLEDFKATTVAEAVAFLDELLPQVTEAAPKV